MTTAIAITGIDRPITLVSFSSRAEAIDHIERNLEELREEFQQVRSELSGSQREEAMLELCFYQDGEMVEDPASGDWHIIFD